MENVNNSDAFKGIQGEEKVEGVKKRKRNPVKFVFLFLLLLFVGFIGFGVYEYFRIKPNDVRFTNITSSSVTVSWNTNSSTSATAMVFEGDTWMPLTVLGLGGERFYDSRDVTKAELEAAAEAGVNSEGLELTMDDFQTEIVVEDMGEYYTHHVTVTGLDPETEYSFMVGERFLYRGVKDVGEASSVRTLEVPESVESPVPAYGSVKDAQDSEDPELLTAVMDGVVYFNLLDEFSGERSTVYSGSLNDDGNWYIDISGVRGEDGKNFLNRYVDGETITNILAEISIDAGPLGRWEGILHGDVIAPAEMIVINDPLQVQIEGVGIRRVDNSFLKDFVPSVEASGCTFAGYCGPCYDGVLSNSCPCPQATLNARPGCKGTESGTMEQAISNVAKASTGCANGSPNQHVWFGGDCKQCLPYTSTSGAESYRWQSVGNDNCPEGKRDGKVIKVVEDPPLKTTTISEINEAKVGSDCYVNGKKGVVRQIDQYENRCDTTTTTISEINEAKVGSDCYVNGKKGVVRQIHQYENRCDIYNLGGSVVEKDSEPEEDPTEVEDKFVISGNKCISTEGITSYTFFTTFTTQRTYYDNKGACELVLDSRDDDGAEEDAESETVYSDEDCWRGGRGYYRILDNGTLQKCTRNNDWVEDSLGKGAQRCADLYDYVAETDNVQCNRRKDFCSIPGVDGSVDYFCNGTIWVKWEDYKEENPDISIPAGPTEVLDQPGDKCLTGRCICPGGGEIDSDEYCPQVASEGCDYSNIGEICSESGRRCQFTTTQEGAAKEFETKREALIYYLNGGEGGVCVKKSNTCYRGQQGNQLQEYSMNSKAVRCLLSDGDSSSKLEKEDYLIGSLGGSSKGQVLAQTDGTSTVDFVIDHETGLVSEIDPGSYLIEYKGEHYTFEVADYELENNDGSLMIYLDKNENGVYDSDTDLKISEIASEITVIILRKEFKYSLKEGLNFISLPFLVPAEEYRTAAGLLEKLNEVYNDAFYSISKFEGKWKMVGQNVEVYGNDDFQLLPGEGYVIKARRNVDISIVGRPVKYESSSDTAPINLYQGWNLIGIYGTGVKTYTAQSMLTDINASNFTADNVSKWTKEKQMYDGSQMSEGQEYGFDFPINPLEGVFVRVLEGRGKWQPKLRNQ
jgi:hypothetical protein